jgi:RNA polymerase sigma-70 factor (ECF subfamily)
MKVQAQLINEAIEKLPVEFREVVILRELEELSYKEIAAITGIPIGTVMSRLSRARKRLLAYLRSTTRVDLRSTNVVQVPVTGNNRVA